MLLDIDPWSLVIICGAAGSAGFIDAVVGGGGLITTPTLLLAFPHAAVALILGTTKSASVVGTLAAAGSYVRLVPLSWRILVPAVAAACPCACAGAVLASHLDATILKPLILIVLTLVGAYTWWNRSLGAAPRMGISPVLQPWCAFTVGGLLGFYDGVLGPGTGTFLIVSLILIFGCDFLRASAHAKIINGASNIGALVWFASHGTVLWEAAIPMAVCNLLGALIGSRLAIAKGNPWIRRVYLVVVAALILRLAVDLGRTGHH
jgi:hypothetical protein